MARSIDITVPTAVTDGLTADIQGTPGVVALRVQRQASLRPAGVLIALALVPAAALVGMGLVLGDGDVAGRAALRLLIDIALVALLSMGIFYWKYIRMHRRRMAPG